VSRSTKPLGVITRGTTNPNRLRRVERWIAFAAAAELRNSMTPLVVDLGYGANAWTARDLRNALRLVRPDVQLVGIEIDPERVAAAQDSSDESLAFIRGGFEIPTPVRPIVIRAFNVLRQYSESEVHPAWRTMTARLADNGWLIEGTCDELGRHAWWVALRSGETEPRTLTLSTRLAGFDRPSELAERLPKALIHRNVSGEKIYEVLGQLDAAWAAAAPYSAFSARQRWIATMESLRAQGIPVQHGPSRWKLGEFTIPWDLVAPAE
jgi:hypothetical protein